MANPLPVNVIADFPSAEVKTILPFSSVYQVEDPPVIRSVLASIIPWSVEVDILPSSSKAFYLSYISILPFTSDATSAICVMTSVNECCAIVERFVLIEIAVFHGLS